MEQKANWADPGRPSYRVKQKPVGKDRLNTEKIPNNDGYPETWLPVKGKILCAADILPFDPSKRRVKKSPQKEFHIEDYPVVYPSGEAAPAEEDPYDVILMGVDFALKDLMAAKDAARAAGQDALAARIKKAVEKAYLIIMGREE